MIYLGGVVGSIFSIVFVAFAIAAIGMPVSTEEGEMPGRGRPDAPAPQGRGSIPCGNSILSLKTFACLPSSSRMMRFPKLC